MTEAPTSAALRLDTPPWAETSERDDEALIHTSSIGAVPDLDGLPLSVEVVQRDELVFTATSTTVQRAEPYIRVGGQRMDAAGARLLSELLSTASNLTAPAPPIPPGDTSTS